MFGCFPDSISDVSDYIRANGKKKEHDDNDVISTWHNLYIYLGLVVKSLYILE